MYCTLYFPFSVIYTKNTFKNLHIVKIQRFLYFEQKIVAFQLNKNASIKGVFYQIEYYSSKSTSDSHFWLALVSIVVNESLKFT